MTTDTSREAVEALMEGVTEGPWEASRCPSNAREIVEHPDLGRIANLSYPDAGDDEANARFIAASRQLVPALLDRAEKAEAERDTLKAQKWDVKHTSTINDLVQLAQARDHFEAERDAAVAELATLKAERDALEAFRSQVANLMLTGDDMGDGTEFEAADHADQHECLEGLIVKARALGDA